MNPRGRQVVVHGRPASVPDTYFSDDDDDEEEERQASHSRRPTPPPALARCKSNEETMSPTSTIHHSVNSSTPHSRTPCILCLSSHYADVQAAAAVVGWQVHMVYSNQEAVEAIHSRAYEALIMGFGTLAVNPYCSPLVGYAQQAAPAMYRLVYSQQKEPLPRELVDECFHCGADAVAWSLQSLVSELCGIRQFESIVPAGTKIAAHQRAIYSAYAPLRHRQQREDQLICIARGKTTNRVHNLMAHTSKLEVQLRHVPPHFIQTVSGRSNPNKLSSIRLVHVSDTNNHHRYLHIPPGDVFVHTGNFTNPEESKANALTVFKDFLDWLSQQVVPKFELVVFIAGNHDDILDRVNHHFLKEHLAAKHVLQCFLQQNPSVRYLENSATIFHDLVIYASPTVYCQSAPPSALEQAPLSNAFERSMDDFKKTKNFDGVHIFLTNRAPSILSKDKDYVLPMDHVYSQVEERKSRTASLTSSKPPTVHCFGHCNANFGIGYYDKTLMMNGSQEMLHSLDKYGGGTPLVVDVPLDESASGKNQAMCGPRLFHRHHNEHSIEC